MNLHEGMDDCNGSDIILKFSADTVFQIDQSETENGKKVPVNISKYSSLFKREG